MKITQDVRDYAKQQGLENMEEVISKGLDDKAQEFNRHGGELYNKI